MPTPSQHVGVKGDECQCGRRATIRHCPSCGSSRVYARMNRAHVLLDGTKRFVDVQFRCQSCGHLFIDAEREFCEAPPVGPKLAAQKAKALFEAKQSGEYMSPKEAKMLRTIEALTGTKALTPEEREDLENKLDFQIRSAWADANFAFESGKGPDPGNCDEWVAARKKEWRVGADGNLEEIKTEEQPK
jgi:hypothetical protein